MDVRYPVKGLYVWYPFGFAMRKHVYSLMRGLLDRDHQEALFPLLIPETELARESAHIKGFEEEVYWVTHGGTTPLDVRLALRPTSECAIYPMYALWIRSHADLPLKLYQIVNTFRYETKHTRPLIRLREITSFQEAHTVHASWEDARCQVEAAIALYREFYDALGVPVILSRRPEWDKFPGADYTMAVDTVMPDGRTLQVGTVHHLGDHFSRTFQIRFEDASGEQKYAFQTCYGVSERCIAALVSLHGDDRGLALPPAVAPVQVVVVPIVTGKRKEEVSALQRVPGRRWRRQGSGSGSTRATSGRAPSTITGRCGVYLSGSRSGPGTSTPARSRLSRAWGRRSRSPRRTSRRGSVCCSTPMPPGSGSGPRRTCAAGPGCRGRSTRSRRPSSRE